MPTNNTFFPIVLLVFGHIPSAFSPKQVPSPAKGGEKKANSNCLKGSAKALNLPQTSCNLHQAPKREPTSASAAQLPTSTVYGCSWFLLCFNHGISTQGQLPLLPGGMPSGNKIWICARCSTRSRRRPRWGRRSGLHGWHEPWRWHWPQEPRGQQWQPGDLPTQAETVHVVAVIALQNRQPLIQYIKFTPVQLQELLNFQTHFNTWMWPQGKWHTPVQFSKGIQPYF